MKRAHLTRISLLVLLISTVAVMAGDVAEDRMSPQAAEHARKGGVDKVDVIVMYHAMPDQAERDRTAALGAETYREFDRLPMRALQVPELALDGLAKENGVRFVAMDDAVEGFSAEARLAANDPAPGTANDTFRGYGVRVAVVDSGLASHVDLSNSTKQYDFLGGAYPRPLVEYDGNVFEIDSYQSQPRSDPWGHGTHVAAIVAGNGYASNGAQRGVATDARLMASSTRTARASPRTSSRRWTGCWSTATSGPTR